MVYLLSCTNHFCEWLACFRQKWMGRYADKFFTLFTWTSGGVLISIMSHVIINDPWGLHMLLACLLLWSTAVHRRSLRVDSTMSCPDCLRNWDGPTNTERSVIGMFGSRFLFLSKQAAFDHSCVLFLLSKFDM